MSPTSSTAKAPAVPPRSATTSTSAAAAPRTPHQPAGTTGGANPVGTSVYGSNGNSLPSPPPEFTQEIRVNTSMYDAQQGATSGAQIDVNTLSGTNQMHGQIYGTFANNALNASPFFFNQEYQLSQQGVGYFPESLAIQLSIAGRPAALSAARC
jgi:hypothetical protein